MAMSSSIAQSCGRPCGRCRAVGRAVAAMPLPCGRPVPGCLAQLDVVAMDCEMVGIAGGDALCKVSLVSLGMDVHGFKTLLNTWVTVEEEVLDFRTPITGIDADSIKSLPSIPYHNARDLTREFIAGKIVVGHALENDFKALGLSHPSRLVRDTATQLALLPPGRVTVPSLRLLAKYWLNEDMHAGVHNSVQDASIALRLYMMHAVAWEAAWPSYDLSSKAAWQCYGGRRLGSPYRSTEGFWALWPPRQLETSIVLQEQPVMLDARRATLQVDASTGPTVSEGSMPRSTPSPLSVVGEAALKAVGEEIRILKEKRRGEGASGKEVMEHANTVALGARLPKPKELPGVEHAATHGSSRRQAGGEGNAASCIDGKDQANISGRIATQSYLSRSGSSKKLGRIWEAARTQHGHHLTEAAKPVSKAPLLLRPELQSAPCDARKKARLTLQAWETAPTAENAIVGKDFKNVSKKYIPSNGVVKVSSSHQSNFSIAQDRTIFDLSFLRSHGEPCVHHHRPLSASSGAHAEESFLSCSSRLVAAVFASPPGLANALIDETTFKPPPGLEHVLDSSSDRCKAIFKAPPGIEDVSDSSSAVTTLTLKPPPGLEEVPQHRKISDIPSQLDSEVVDDQKPITRCTLLAIRTACKIDMYSQSSERAVIALMCRDQLIQQQHVSSTLGAFPRTPSSQCKLLGQVDNCECIKPCPLIEVADDLEGAILPCSKQQIEVMGESLLKGAGFSIIGPRNYIFSMFLAMLLIIFAGCIVLALHSTPQDREGGFRPLALLILRAEVGLRSLFSRTQNAPSFLAPMYEQLLPSSPAGPSSIHSVQMYGGR